MHRERAADNERRKGSAVIATSLPRLKDPLQQPAAASGGSVHRDGPVLGGVWGDESQEVGVTEGRERRGRKEETRRDTTQTEGRSCCVSVGSNPAIVHTLEGGYFCDFPGVVTHAKLRENGGICNRRGRAVVRPAGPGAG